MISFDDKGKAVQFIQKIFSQDNDADYSGENYVKEEDAWYKNLSSEEIGYALSNSRWSDKFSVLYSVYKGDIREDNFYICEWISDETPWVYDFANDSQVQVEWNGNTVSAELQHLEIASILNKYTNYSVEYSVIETANVRCWKKEKLRMFLQKYLLLLNLW